MLLPASPESLEPFARKYYMQGNLMPTVLRKLARHYNTETHGLGQVSVQYYLPVCRTTKILKCTEKLHSSGITRNGDLRALESKLILLILLHPSSMPSNASLSMLVLQIYARSFVCGIKSKHLSEFYRSECLNNATMKLS